MSAAATVLSCIMTLAHPQPALADHAITLNIVLQRATASAMAHGEQPIQPIAFVGEDDRAKGWILHNGLDSTITPIAISRVTAGRPLMLTQGHAERQPDGRYRFTEMMRGPCRLISESELK